MWMISNITREAMMSLLTSPKKHNIRKTKHTRPLITKADAGLGEGLGKNLTCNEAEVDALLSSGEST
jgi:hypothetical protein